MMLTENTVFLASSPFVMIKGFLEIIEEIGLTERAEWEKCWKIDLLCLAPPLRYFVFSRQDGIFFLKDLEMKALQIFLGMMAKQRNLYLTLEV